MFYDAIIIGGGPAGLTASMYLSRGGFSTLLIEKNYIGGQIILTQKIENYPGVLSTSGIKLTKTMEEQARLAGVSFLYDEVTAVETQGKEFLVACKKETLTCHGLIIAAGCHPKKAGFDGEEKWTGRGVSYCAVCDGTLYKGKEVFVIGSGYSALQESLYLSSLARQVTIFTRGDDFHVTPAMKQKIEKNEKIRVFHNTVVEKVNGQEGITGIHIRHLKDNSTCEFLARDDEFFGIFVFAGYSPSTVFLAGLSILDENGYIPTDETLKTRTPGIYAAGDVRAKYLRQVVSATGDGACAANALSEYLKNL